jgi:hypothetical protein
VHPLRVGTLGTSRISGNALLDPAVSVGEVTVAAVAVVTMRVIDDAYRAAGLALRP